MTAALASQKVCAWLGSLRTCTFPLMKTRSHESREPVDLFAMLAETPFARIRHRNCLHQHPSRWRGSSPSRFARIAKSTLRGHVIRGSTRCSEDSCTAQSRPTLTLPCSCIEYL